MFDVITYGEEYEKDIYIYIYISICYIYGEEYEKNINLLYT